MSSQIHMGRVPPRMKLEEQSRKVRKMMLILRERMHAEKLERRMTDIMKSAMRVLREGEEEDEGCEHVGRKCMCYLLRLEKQKAIERAEEVLSMKEEEEEE